MSVGHYQFVRHTGPRDFVRDCVRFAPTPCFRCGAMPERAEWISCLSCQQRPWKDEDKPAVVQKKRGRKLKPNRMTIKALKEK